MRPSRAQVLGALLLAALFLIFLLVRYGKLPG
jgi:hypothetical protein